uniref:DUF4806 domain-containing protein n=1 Tax=Gadus morhua TaxID=8049 RepID=A0A8C5BCR8_GADMO
MSFHLIKFANGDIAVVPENWCDDGMVYWPKYKNTERAKRAAANSETPESNWTKYDVMIIRTSLKRDVFHTLHFSYISCLSSAAEVHILNLLETIKQQQDQLVAKVNYLCSRMNSTPGPDVEMPDSIDLPLEHLEAVEAFEVFLKEPSNYPISSLATIGGQDLKRVTWNILGRLYTDDVSHQINWKGVNNKKAFSQMSAKSLLFSAVRKNSITKSVTDAEVTKHTIRWFNLAMDRATKRRGVSDHKMNVATFI